MTQAEEKAKAALRKSMELNGDLQTEGKRVGDMEQRIINVLAGIVLGFLGWWSNNIWNTVQLMQSQVTTLNVELARNYVPRAELQQNFERIYNALERIDKQTQKGSQK